jgi:uncharacterized membrane protein YkvA (DUF1232 family)
MRFGSATRRVPELARVVPALAILFGRLARDPRVPLARRLQLLLLAGYLASPIDLIPDFIPVVGQLDDAAIVALVLRSIVRSVGPELMRDNWPGTQQSLNVVLRLAGYP